MDNAASTHLPDLFPLFTQTLNGGSQPLSGLVQPTPVREVLGFRKRDALSTFRRILTSYLRAFEAERGGRWDRATFYWHELWRLIDDAGADDRCWSAGREVVGAPFHDVPAAEFRARLLHDVFIGSHAAFFRAQVEAELDPLDRPLLHLEGISRIGASLPAGDAGNEALLVNALASIGFARYGDSSRDIEDFCFALLKYFPRQSQFVDIALNQMYARTMKELEQATGRTKSVALDDVLSRVLDVNRRYPDKFSSYQLLGVLFHEQALTLAESGEIAAALLASRKAEAYGGQHPVLTETHRQLAEAMQVMRVRARELQDAQQRNASMQLNSKGLQLVRNGTDGGALAETWNGSTEADHVRSRRQAARTAPRRDPHDRQGAIPSIALEQTTDLGGQPDLRDILASSEGRRLRLQAVAAVLLALVVGGLLANDALERRAHRQNLARVQAARLANDDVATLRALADFFDDDLSRRDAAASELVPVYVDTFARWFTTLAGGLSADDRLVVTNYRQQIVDRGLESPEVLR